MVPWELFLISVICLLKVNSQAANNQELVDIATLDTNSTELQEDLHKGMPDTLKFTLNTMNNSKTIKLHLTRKKNVKENSFVFVVRQDKNGKSVLVKEDVPVEKNIGLYQDKKTGGAFTVRCEGLQDGHCNPVLIGSIHIDNIEYDLTEISTLDKTSTELPVTRKKRQAKKDKKKSKHRKRVYALMKRKRPRVFAQDYKTFDKNISPKNTITKETQQPLGKALSLRMSENIIDIGEEKFPVLGRTMVSTSRSRMGVAPDDTFNVEVLLVIDYSIYLREYNAITDPNVWNKDLEAKSRIRQYFAHVVNGINLRYDNIDTNKFHIDVAVSGYIIADKPEIAVWTDGRVTGDLVDSDDALDSLRNWRLRVSEFPEHDHMMLFTSTDLYRRRPSDNKVTGLASFRAMCTTRSVSVVEDNGVFGSISTGTHELAHSLGARHDGTSPNMCSSSEQYIMAVSGGITNSINELNPWKFSPCSIDELYRFLSSLPAGNCLTDEALIYDMDEFNRVTKNEVGQVYNPNEQCKQRAGKNSFYGWGGGLGEFSDICTSMSCKSETSKNSYLIYTAARGTSCGDKRWCVNGICKRDPNAPAKDDSCVHGDSLRLFKGKSCPDLIREDPSKCYENYYREFCCKTCKDIAKPIKGCEYGDKNSFCSTVFDRPHLCYSQRNQDVCCDSCQSLHTGYRGCEYGDKVHQNGGRQCSKWRCSRNPDYQKACCKTCGLIPDILITPKPKPVRTTPKPSPTMKPKPPPVRPTRPKPTPVKPTRPKPTPTKPTRPNPPPVRTTRPNPPPVVPTRPARPPTKPVPSGRLCVTKGGSFGAMSCGLVARFMTDVCSMSVLGDACCGPCKTKSKGNICEDIDICTNVKSHNCYDSNIKERCCSTCKAMETGDQDCLYGDKSSSCERYIFMWPDYVCVRHKDRCCGSCKRQGTSRRRTTTFTILPRRMENNIANNLDTSAGSPFGKTDVEIPAKTGESAVDTTDIHDAPLRGDQIPIAKEKTKSNGDNKKNKIDKKEKKHEKIKKRGRYSQDKGPTDNSTKGDKGNKDSKGKRRKGKHWKKHAHSHGKHWKKHSHSHSRRGRRRRPHHH